MKRIKLILILLFHCQFLIAQELNLVLQTYNGENNIQAAKSVTLKNGFYIPQGTNAQISIGGLPAMKSVETRTQNYILNNIFRVAGINPSNMAAARTADQENRNIQYIDGFGRPIQATSVMGSTDYGDIVQYSEYDPVGRERYQYLPYVAYGNEGSFRIGDANNVKSFYQSNPLLANGTAFPFAETVYEKNELGRTEQIGAPGQVWQVSNSQIGNSGHTVKFAYTANTANEVRLWRMIATDGATASTFYAANKLEKLIKKDENWVSGKTGTREEFRNLQGQLVLIRIWQDENSSIDTYYVYDIIGNLRYVIPPGYKETSVSENANGFDELIYAYKYDNKQRLIQKKIPGKGWEWLVYNAKDKVVLQQDANQRALNRWTYIKYDAFDRIVETGHYTKLFASQVLAQSDVNTVTKYWEEREGAADYSNLAYPRTAKERLTTVYYDDYSFNGGSLAKLQPLGVTKSSMTKGLLTGRIIWKDDRTDSMLTINYYDDYGRLIQNVSQNHLKGTDRETNEYSFTNELLKSTRIHTPATGLATTLVMAYEYDHVGRLLQTKKKVNAQAEVIQSRFVYNEIGQPKTKSLHSENGGANFMTSIAYQYNERGWLTRIGAPQFVSQLNYYINGNTILPNAQYNGNIAQQLWGHGTMTSSTFDYSYDALSRLTSSVSTGTVMSEVLSYDEMGNIKTLTRDNSPAINYNYNNANKSNKLASLSGGLIATFTYDLNGNATKDRTGMALTYSYLNQPKTAIGGGRSVVYSYDALGSKLNRKSTVNNITTEQDYIGGIEYSKTGSAAPVIERIATEDGFLLNSGGTYSYYYNLTDHLGNIRVVLKKEGSAALPIATVMQRQDYYPFGKTKSIATSINNKYLYNGKEMQSDLNGGTHNLGSTYILEGQLDYGARFYDAEIGRWNVVDPLASSYYSYSPYTYTANNPILFIDPDGRYFKEYDDAEAYYAENPNGKLDGSDGHWRTSDRKYNTSVWKNANKTNIQKNDGFKEYENLDQRADFYRWFQDETSSRGFETKWAGAAASTVDKLKNLLGFGATMTGYSNDEIKNFVTLGNKMIMDDVWGGLQDLYNGNPVKGDAARIWDGDQLLKEQNVINGSYWKLSNSSLNTLENSLKKNYFLSKFIPGPVFNGSIMSITDRWKYGMGMMGYKNLPPISTKYKHQ